MVSDEDYNQVIGLVSKKIIKTDTAFRNLPLFRCPFCGDSSKKEYKGHLILNKKLPIYYCFRCGEKGSINRLLKLLGISFRLKNVFNYRDKSQLVKSSSNEIKIENTTIKKSTIKYIIDRVGFSKQLLSKIKNILVGDPIHILESNDIPIKKPIWGALKYNDYVSFISNNKEKIVCRAVNDSAYMKHITLNIKPNLDFFVLFQKTLKDIYHQDNITVVVGEGMFDIMGFYRICEERNIIDDIDIFIAARGQASIVNCVKYVFTRFLSKLNVIFLADQDTIFKIKNNIYSRVKYLLKNYSIIANRNDKDFGDINKTQYELVNIGGNKCII